MGCVLRDFIGIVATEQVELLWSCPSPSAEILTVCSQGLQLPKGSMFLY
jgi:hypothetical protein